MAMGNSIELFRLTVGNILTDNCDDETQREHLRDISEGLLLDVLSAYERSAEVGVHPEIADVIKFTTMLTRTIDRAQYASAWPHIMADIVANVAHHVNNVLADTAREAWRTHIRHMED